MNKDIFRELKEYFARPPLFEPGEPKFWDDEYISEGMLEAHLNQEYDAASRRIDIIDKETDNLVSSGTLKPGDRVLDLGCGPGLYASRLCRKGMKLTGVDISRRSLEYATRYARDNGLEIEYICADFFDIEYSGEFDVVVQIYGECSTFPEDRLDYLLGKIRKALKLDGQLIFDVSTRAQRRKEGAKNHWYVFDGGLWRPGKHIVLEEGFDYPEHDVWLDQYIVVDDDRIAVYRDWFHDYNLQSITAVLEKAGFNIVQVWNDLTGTPYEEGGDWIAVVARKK